MRKALTVTVDAWGNIIVAGPLGEMGHGSEMFVAKLDKDGQLLWHRGLEGARSSSLPPSAPGVAAADDPRDSVQPHLLDDVVASRRNRRSTFRAIGAAVLVAFAVVGTSAAIQQTRAPSPQRALMQHDVVGAAAVAGELSESSVDAAVSQLPAGSLVSLAPAPLPVLDASELRRETLALLSAGLPREALPFARAYVDAAPGEALSYLFLGATLQDLGRANEAREIYNDCVKLADSGDASDCYALGGRK